MNEVSEGWVSCPPGELDQLGVRLRGRRLLRLWLITAALVLGASAGLAGAWGAAQWAWSSTTQPAPTGDCCPSCAPREGDPGR
jgi:hypothetical protein